MRFPGLIPACAGKTSNASIIKRQIRAHPRVCGENFVAFHAASSKIGSSPRVRGKRLDEAACSVFERLIPACAGKTIMEQTADAHGKAHPRVCGENVQGALMLRADWRLIPACAGKTEYNGSVTKSLEAHPRVCGENMA